MCQRMDDFKKCLKFLYILLTIFIVICCSERRLPNVVIGTSLGKIVLAIDTINAPVSGSNFLYHVENGTYDNALFYRVVRPDNQPNDSVKIQVIQGGLYSEEEICHYICIRHETTKETRLKHLNGTLSMARSEPGTASTEFFICIGDQPELDFGGKRNPDGRGFSVFGQVTHGMEIVHRIHGLKERDQYLAEKVRIDSIIIQ